MQGKAGSSGLLLLRVSFLNMTCLMDIFPYVCRVGNVKERTGNPDTKPYAGNP
jgi:hypothetical protein